MEELQRLVKTLAQARQELQTATAAYDAVIQVFQQENAQTIQALENAKVAERDAKSQLSEAAVAQFLARGDGEKTLYQGVSIKEYDTPVYDAEVSLRWASEHMPTLLVLDTKAYEKVLLKVHTPSVQKALSDMLDLVDNAALLAIRAMPGHIEKRPKASIASDLNEHLDQIPF